MNEIVDLDRYEVENLRVVKIKGKSLKIPFLTLTTYQRAIAFDGESDLSTRLKNQHELTREIFEMENPGVTDDNFWKGLSIDIMKKLFFAILNNWSQLEKKEMTESRSGQSSPPLDNGSTSAPSISPSPLGSAGLPTKSEP